MCLILQLQEASVPSGCLERFIVKVVLKLSAESGLCAHWHKPSSANPCPRALTAVSNLGRHLSVSATRPAHVCMTSIIFLSHTCVSSNAHAESQRRKPLALALSLAAASRPHRSAVFCFFISLSLLSSISLFFSLCLFQPNLGIQNGSHPWDERFIYCAAGRPRMERCCMALVDTEKIQFVEWWGRMTVGAYVKIKKKNKRKLSNTGKNTKTERVEAAQVHRERVGGSFWVLKNSISIRMGDGKQRGRADGGDQKKGCGWKSSN